MAETTEMMKWEKPKLTIISAGGIKENILSGSGVPRGGQSPEPE